MVEDYVAEMLAVSCARLFIVQSNAISKENEGKNPSPKKRTGGSGAPSGCVAGRLARRRRARRPPLSKLQILPFVLLFLSSSFDLELKALDWSY